MDAEVRIRKPLSDAALAQLFNEARTYNAFLDILVPDELLKRAVELAKMGPTSANQSPLRIVFLRSQVAKERLRSAMSAGNLAKTMKAPVVAIAARDEKFYEHLPFLIPHVDAQPWFTSSEEVAKRHALVNGTLQVAYLILGLRAVGLDTGPMGGFDAANVDAEFFPDGRFKSNILINIGYGEASALFPRLPRFAFDQIAKII